MNIIFYRHNPTKPFDISEHVIDFNDLTFILSGQMIYYIDGQKIHVKAKDAIFIKSGSMRKRVVIGACDYVSFNFLDKNIVLPPHLENVVGLEIKHIIASCDEIYKNYFEWQDKISHALNLLISILHSNLQIQKEHPLVIKIKRFIRSNFNNKITLSDVAKDAQYSPNYCESIFKKETGKSIIDYLIDTRISEATNLIDEGATKLVKIAELVGFDDYNYFSRCFKKRLKYPPLKYKKMLKK